EMMAVISFFNDSHFMASANATTRADERLSTAARPGVRLAPQIVRAATRPGMEEDMSPENRSLTSYIVSLGVVLASIAVFAQTLGSPERFTAAAINMNRGAAGSIDIQVDRWSSDAERDRLINALTTKGADKLLDVLQDLPVKGNFRAPGQLGW